MDLAAAYADATEKHYRIRSFTVNVAKREIYTGGEDGTIKVWSHDSKDQGRVVRLLLGHAGWVSSLLYVPEYRLLFSASVDQRLIVWNQLGDVTCALKVRSPVYSIACDVSRNLLFLGGKEILMIYQLEGDLSSPSLVKFHSVIKSHEDIIHHLIYYEEAGRMFSASYDRSLCIYDSFRGHRFKRLPEIHKGAISCLYLNRQSDSLITGGYDRVVKVWSLDGVLKHKLDVLSSTVMSMCFVEPLDCFWLCMAHSRSLLKLDLSRNIVSERAFADGPTVPESHGNLVNVVFVPELQEVIGYTSQGHLLTWRKNEVASCLEWRGHTDWIEDLAYCCRDSLRATVFSASSDGRLFQWTVHKDDLESAKIPEEIRAAQGSTHVPILAVAFDPVLGVVITAGADQLIRVWQFDSHQLYSTSDSTESPLRIVLEGHRDRVTALSVPRDACHSVSGTPIAAASSGDNSNTGALFSIGDDGLLCAWDLYTGRLLCSATRIASEYLFDVCGISSQAAGLSHVPPPSGSDDPAAFVIDNLIFIVGASGTCKLYAHESRPDPENASAGVVPVGGAVPGTIQHSTSSSSGSSGSLNSYKANAGDTGKSSRPGLDRKNVPSSPVASGSGGQPPSSAGGRFPSILKTSTSSSGKSGSTTAIQRPNSSTSAASSSSSSNLVRFHEQTQPESAGTGRPGSSSILKSSPSNLNLNSVSGSGNGYSPGSNQLLSTSSAMSGRTHNLTFLADLPGHEHDILSVKWDPIRNGWLTLDEDCIKLWKIVRAEKAVPGQKTTTALSSNVNAANVDPTSSLTKSNSTTLSRTPSEPVLSEAAAKLLNELTLSTSSSSGPLTAAAMDSALVSDTAGPSKPRTGNIVDNGDDDDVADFPLRHPDCGEFRIRCEQTIFRPGDSAFSAFTVDLQTGALVVGTLVGTIYLINPATAEVVKEVGVAPDGVRCMIHIPELEIYLCGLADCSIRGWSVPILPWGIRSAMPRPGSSGGGGGSSFLSPYTMGAGDYGSFALHGSTGRHGTPNGPGIGSSGPGGASALWITQSQPLGVGPGSGGSAGTKSGSSGGVRRAGAGGTIGSSLSSLSAHDGGPGSSGDSNGPGGGIGGGGLGLLLPGAGGSGSSPGKNGVGRSNQSRYHQQQNRSRSNLVTVLTDELFSDLKNQRPSISTENAQDVESYRRRPISPTNRKLFVMTGLIDREHRLHASGSGGLGRSGGFSGHGDSYAISGGAQSMIAMSSAGGKNVPAPPGSGSGSIDGSSRYDDSVRGSKSGTPPVFGGLRKNVLSRETDSADFV